MLFAGLLAETDGGPFAILTDDAQGPVREVHDRVPIMLTAARARAWVTANEPFKGSAIKLLATEVSPRANSVANDDADLL